METIKTKNMNYVKIKADLIDYKVAEVEIFITYLKFLENEKKKDGNNYVIKNKWFANQNEQSFIDLYKKVAIDNLFIDGDTITLQYKGKLMVSYNYQAYKNKLLNVYPETKFDIQIVHDGDEFSFKKESGNVVYTHELVNPFNKNLQIIGAYCIIKNQRGEFLETINVTDIDKFKSCAKTKNIWDAWESEMILKSVMKRACKRHFKDLVNNIDVIDNENNDLSLVNIDAELQKRIESCVTKDELNIIYKEENPKSKDKIALLKLLKKREGELI